MRLIIITVLWLGLFAVLVRLLPPGYYLPLYCLFLLGGIGYVIWERRRIQNRRTLLEEAYRAQSSPLPAPDPLPGEEE